MEHRPNLCLLRSGLPDLAEPLAVDGLAAAHPIWSGAAALFKDAQEDGRGRLIAEGDPDGPWVILCGTCVSSLDVAWELIRTENLPPAWGAVLAVS